jgi:hypothetical protein
MSTVNGVTYTITGTGTARLATATGKTNSSVPSNLTFENAVGTPAANVRIVATNLFKDVLNVASDQPFTQVNFQSNMQTIQASAFQNCSNLNKIDLNSVWSIFGLAFATCTGLKELTLPASLSGKSLALNAFQNCTNIEIITLKYSITNANFNTLVQNMYNSNALLYKLKRLVFDYVGSTGSAGLLATTSSLQELKIEAPISLIGTSAFRNYINLTKIEIVGGTVNQTIDQKAFEGCTSLVDVTLGTRITNISISAFTGCIGLTKMTFPKQLGNINVGGFKDCPNIKEIIFENETGASYLAINDYSFERNYGITKLVIPNKVTAIGQYAFSGCSNITELDMGQSMANIAAIISNMNVTQIHTFKMYNSAIPIPGMRFGPNSNCLINLELVGVYSIVPSAFLNYGALKNVTITSDDRRIAAIGANNTAANATGVFQNCVELNNLKMYGVTAIWQWTFRNCIKLTTLSLDSNMKSISDNAFNNCSGITKLEINSYLSNLSAVVSSMPLTDIILNYSNLAIPLGRSNTLKNVALSNITNIEAQSFQNHTLIETITIPSTALQIKTSAFAGCSSLTWIGGLDSNNSLQEIGDAAFIYCGNLKQIPLNGSKNLNLIRQYAFWNCFNLQEINLPNSVTSIQAKAFKSCFALQRFEINIVSSILKEIGSQVFLDCKTLKDIRLPNGITKLGIGCFENCIELTQIINDANHAANLNNLLVLPEAVFIGCTKLSIINIPIGTTLIDKSAFEGCTGLTQIVADWATLQTKLTKIAENAFNGCNSLKELIINKFSIVPANQINLLISEAAFTNCSSITKVAFNVNNAAGVTISLGTTTTTIDSSVGVFEGCASLQELNMKGVKYIMFNTFKNCTGLTSIYLGTELRIVKNNAFTGCNNLTQMEIELDSDLSNNIPSIIAPITNLSDISLNYYNKFPIIPLGKASTLKNLTMNGITNIGANMFQNYTALQSLQFDGSGVTIQSNAFQNCNGLTSLFLSNNIRRVEDNAFFNCTNCTKLIVNRNITNSTGTSNVTLISQSMYLTDMSLNFIGKSDVFEKKGTLKNLTLSGITLIESNAFKEHFRLENLYIDASGVLIDASGSGVLIKSQAFKDCASLSFITMSRVTKIEENAFTNCTSLKSISLPSTVTSVHSDAFLGCSGITAFNIVTNLTNYAEIIRDMDINAVIFDYAGKLPKIQKRNIKNVTLNGITNIDDGAFALCNEITTITLSQQLTSISDSCFYRCGKLKNISFPEVKHIGTQAFNDCVEIKEFNFPTTLKTMGNKIFQGCTDLTKIYINSEIKNLGGALYGMDNEELDIELNYTGGIPDGTFYNKSFFKAINLDGRGITKIGKSVFESCKNFTSINFSQTSIKIIDNRAFYNCINLPEINMPASITQIGDYTFSNCTSLTTFNIPESVKSIGKYAFSGCTGLTRVNLVNNGLTAIGEFAFKNCVNLTSIALPPSFIITNQNIFEGCKILLTIT